MAEIKMRTEPDMPTLTNNKSVQIRPRSGVAFWSFSAERLRELTTEEHDVTKAYWDGREWICKQDERSLNEVVGYQIASTIELPLQPWVVFWSSAPRSIGTGMFIEWWTCGHFESCLVDLGEKHAPLVARGLAFWVFGRDEWPKWLLSQNMSDLRLIDLDGTGPLLTVPPHGTLLRNYLNTTDSVFYTARREADRRGITNTFHAELLRLLAVDFFSVVDLSGHPSACALTKAMLSGLQTRQRRLAKLLKAD
jgi:hypothetical protein